MRREAILRAAYAVAAREGLAGVTARAVAADCRISSGLVFFHFRNKDELLIELLDWLLAHTLVAGEIQLPGGAPLPTDPVARMLAVVRRDLEFLPRTRARVELFFDYWVLGTRHPVIRERIRAALERYRDSFLPLTAAVVRLDPGRWGAAGAAGLAATAASFVEGCALQAVLDPARFDVDRAMTTLAALIGQPRPAGGRERSARRSTAPDEVRS